MRVLIDNGHGAETPGKRSPDGRLLEYAWTREMAIRLQSRLAELGIESTRITPENSDIPLGTRCRRANAEAKKESCILVSLHNDALGNSGKWMTASGWSARVSLNASSNSKKLATFLALAAQQMGLKVRKPDATHYYWRQNLAICRDTSMPAVLVENLFQDSKADVEYLLSESGKETLCEALVKGICDYIGIEYDRE